jgi:hypothetical protein
MLEKRKKAFEECMGTVSASLTTLIQYHIAYARRS